VNAVMYYDSDSRRQGQRERVAAIREEYQRVQRHEESRTSAAMRHYAHSAWSHMRMAVARRAPVSRA
jgi:hypothetical protein